MAAPQISEGRLKATADDDHIQIYMSHVLDVVPDVDPDWLRKVIEKHEHCHHDSIVKFALGVIHDGAFYPKRPPLLTGKRKYGESSANNSSHAPHPGKRCKVDYASSSRPRPRGVDYFALALIHLQVDFPRIPEDYLRSLLLSFNSAYAPTHLFLLNQQREQEKRRRQNERTILPYAPRTTAFWYGCRGKGRRLEDVEFEEERQWLFQHLANSMPENINPKDDSSQEARGAHGRKNFTPSDQPHLQPCCALEERDAALNINLHLDCSSCHSSSCSSAMLVCPNMHRFCGTCVITHASNLLHAHNPDIRCLSTDVCDAFFSEVQLRRCLPAKMIDMWKLLMQRKEITVGVMRFEECLLREWGDHGLVGDEEEPFSRCESTDACGSSCCGRCRKMEAQLSGRGDATFLFHSTEDRVAVAQTAMEGGGKLSGQYTIEQVMSLAQALIRRCPECQMVFVKEGRCNRMVCPNPACGAISCYICRQIIEDRLHFDPALPEQSTPQENSGKCRLWQAVEERPNVEVSQTADRVLEDIKGGYSGTGKSRTNVEGESKTDDETKVGLPAPLPQRPLSPVSEIQPVPQGAPTLAAPAAEQEAPLPVSNHAPISPMRNLVEYLPYRQQFIHGHEAQLCQAEQVLIRQALRLEQVLLATPRYPETCVVLAEYQPYAPIVFEALRTARYQIDAARAEIEHFRHRVVSVYPHGVPYHVPQ